MAESITATRPDSIEHLNHTPVCGHETNHRGNHPTATHWSTQHGCVEALLCTMCVRSNRRSFELVMRKFGSVLCDVCSRSFTEYTACVTVRPL